MGLLEHQRAAIAAAYDKYADLLYRVALSYLQHPEDASDVVQDVFAKYMKQAPLNLLEEQERAWFLRVTLNQCHDLYRKNKYREYVPIEDLSEVLTLDAKEDSEQLADLMMSLSKLPEKYRSVIILHYLEDFSVEQIARMLTITQSAVKMRLKRGRELLKCQIGKEDTNV